MNIIFGEGEHATVERCIVVEKDEEDDTNPAWMRYMPKESNSSTVRVDPDTNKRKPVVKRTSNKFGPYNTVQSIIKVKRKADGKCSEEEVDGPPTVDQLNQKRRRYVRSNVNEASKLLEMFDMKK